MSSYLQNYGLVVLDLEPGRRELFLLGGSARFGTGLLLTQQDCEGLIQRTTHLARGLRDRLALRAILLLGCDLSDRKLKKLFYWITRHRTRKDGLLFISGPLAPDEFWASWNPVSLNANPSDLLLELSGRISSPRPGDMKPQISAPITGRMPYKYLDYYEAADGPLFFGRVQEIRKFSSEILSAPRRITILCGRSGVGKTSLVQAGLIPFLERETDIVAVYLRCGEHPERSIIEALGSRLQMVPAAPGTPIHLADALREAYANDARLQVIFIDQAEEAFIKLGPWVLHTFAAAVEECLADPDGVTRFVFVIREDFLSRMAILGGEIPGVLSNVCRLDDLSRNAAHIAVLKPAALCGIRVEEGLAEAILDDLSPDNILPAHLQIVCDQVYRACDKDRKMTLTAYQNLGRASVILRGHLKQAMSAIPSDLEPAARSVLGALVTSEHTKDLVTLEEIATRTGLDFGTAMDANQYLIHCCRLVREVRGKEGFFELSHESLAESVAVWLSQVQADTRAAQELIDQEVSTAKRVPAHLIKLDRLKLIERHRASLYLRPEALILVIASYVAQSGMPEFWRSKVETLAPQDAWEALIFRPARASPLASLGLVVREGIPQLKTAPPGGLPHNTEPAVVEWVRLSTSEALYQATPLLSLFATPALARAMLENVVDLSLDELNRIIRATGGELGKALVEAVAQAVKEDVSWKAIPHVIGVLFDVSEAWPSATELRDQLIRALRALLDSPSSEQRDLANFECARLALMTRSAVTSRIAAHEIDKSALLRLTLSRKSELAKTGIEFFLITESHDQVVSVLRDLDRFSEVQHTFLESKLYDSGRFGVEAIVTAVSKAVPSESLLRLACTVFCRYWLADVSGSNTSVLLNVLLDAMENGPSECLLLITRSLVSLKDTDLADAVIARLPTLDSKTAQTLLGLSWPDWGWVAAAVLGRCQDHRVRREVVTRFVEGITHMSARALASMLHLDRFIASETVKALALIPGQFQHTHGEVHAILDALHGAQMELGAAQGAVILGLRIKLCDAHLDSSVIQDTLLPLLRQESGPAFHKLSDIEVRIVCDVVAYWIAYAGGLSNLEPKTRAAVTDALRGLSLRGEESDRVLGKVFASDPDASFLSLRHGSPSEHEGLINALLVSKASPHPDIQAVLRRLSQAGNVLVRAKSSVLLLRWGDVAGLKGAARLLGRKGRRRPPNVALEMCTAGIREYAKNLSAMDLCSALSDEAIGHLVLPEIITSHGKALLENVELLGVALNTLSQLPWTEASKLRSQVVRLYPEIVEKLRNGAVQRNSRQRYQVKQILQQAGR